MSVTPEVPQSASEQFTLDHLGNRYQHTDKTGFTHTYQHNIVNQYDEEVYFGVPFSFSHDDNGNLSVDKDGNLYFYDYRNRLIEVQDSNSVTQAEYVFDALGRRIKKVVGNTTAYFFYDPQGKVIAEYEGATPDLTKEYVWGNGINEILAMFTPYDAGDPDDWDAFLGFVSTWLLSSGQTGYNDSFDYVNDNKIDLKDFAHWASVWDMPSNRESDWYYLTDALGSVRGLVGGRFQREDDREFYNYDVYGRLSIQNPEESVSGNPYLFGGYRYDSEINSYYTPGRTHDPQTGRWLQFDKDYFDSYNLYEYVASNPIMYIDLFGTNLYAIGGTTEEYTQGKNVAKFYNRYDHDGGPKVGQGKYYWDGPGTRSKKVLNTLTGNDSGDIVLGVVTQICKDFCKDKKMQVNLVGWSRGAVITLEVAEDLNKNGCFCCNSICLPGTLWFGRNSTYYPRVNWVGLFDAVDMTKSIEVDTGYLRTTRIDHAIKTNKRQMVFPFPTLRSDGFNYREHYFYTNEGKSTSHSDIGTEDMYLIWMMRRASDAGLVFNWNGLNVKNP